MNFTLNMNTVNQIQKDTIIYESGDPFTSICLLLKGRILVESNGIRTVFNSGNFLGICDIKNKTHSFTYTALENAVLYAFPIYSQKDFQALLQHSEDYYGLINTSLNFFISEMNETYTQLGEECNNLREFLFSQYDLYQKTGKEQGISTQTISPIETIKQESTEAITLHDKVPYYVESSTIPVNIQKNFYTGSHFVSMLHFDEQRECITSLLSALSHRSKELMRYFRIMILDEQNLFSLVSKMAMNLGHMEKNNTTLVNCVDELLQRINDTELFLTEKLGQKISVNREKMENIYFALISGGTVENIQVSQQDHINDLENSLEQILNYVSIDNKIKEEFTSHVNGFKSLSDKISKSDVATKARKKLVLHYYDIYEAVLLKSFKDANPPTAVRLFLTFGYVSEDFFTSEQLSTLLSLQPKSRLNDGCDVYLYHEWLRAIYDLKKEPSKNEFDLDYTQYLREERSRNNITEADEKMLLSSPEDRVHFEIQNLFRYANRILHGKLTTFVPILFAESFLTTLENSYLTADKINTTIANIQAIDFSIFYRENVVSFEKLGIQKEVFVQKYYPDIILFPIYGQNSSMWQETTGKKKASKGRFLFPILLEADLDKEILKILGAFRWEICRSEQGIHWNDLHYPSLVSEYTDYLQFYRKNSALSADTREKIKSQLTSSNNKHRSVFEKDYADWIIRESKGSMRLNKVVRNILGTYCPFRKEIRIKLNEQQAYADAGKRFVLERGKRLRQIESSYNRFVKTGAPIPKEFQDTVDYFRNT